MKVIEGTCGGSTTPTVPAKRKISEVIKPGDVFKYNGATYIVRGKPTTPAIGSGSLPVMLLGVGGIREISFGDYTWDPAFYTKYPNATLYLGEPEKD